MYLAVRQFFSLRKSKMNKFLKQMVNLFVDLIQTFKYNLAKKKKNFFFSFGLLSLGKYAN